ncbi:MAG TPA: hypothetical protein PLT68_03625 [Actinomycetota bacterium]|nr:hypothetical protein [Actinomycetota bacterium]
MQSPEVVLTVPAESSFVSLVRTATAAISAQADFTLDALDDLQLAVAEACALVIADTPAGADLTVGFQVLGGQVRVDLAAASVSGRPVGTGTFAWTVLTALVDRVRTDVRDGVLHIELFAHGVGPVDP